MDLEAALIKASQEFGLQEYYRELVRPILNLPPERWPLCCGGGCEPCIATLVGVAARVQELMRDQNR